MANNPCTNRPRFVRNVDGRYEMFCRGQDSALWHAWQLSGIGIGEDSWSDWKSLGGKLASDFIIPRMTNNGQLQIFACGRDGRIRSIRQTSPRTLGQRGWEGWKREG